MSDDPWGELRKHWVESAERERKNPPADRPPYEWMVDNANYDLSAAPSNGCYVIEDGSTGVHYATRCDIGFWVHEAGDLWPSKPLAWFPLKSWISPIPKGPSDDNR